MQSEFRRFKIPRARMQFSIAEAFVRTLDRSCQKDLILRFLHAALTESSTFFIGRDPLHRQEQLSHPI